MHRSGTSVLTHAIETLGAHLGSQLIAANEGNEKGYFENISIVRQNDKILKSLDCNWDSLSIPNLTNDQIAEYSVSLTDLLLSEYKNIDFWGIKDPRLIRLNNIWQSVFKNLNIMPYYLLANRNPFEVANSLYVRNKIPISISLLLWVQHQVDSLELLLNRGGLVVNYDAMLSNPKYEIERLAKFLNIDTNFHKNEINDFASQFVNKSLNHNKNNTESPSLLGLELLCNTIYENLSQLSSLPNNLILDNDQVYRCKTIISEARNYFTKNEEFIFEIYNIKKTHDIKTEEIIFYYEDKIIKSNKEVGLLKSKLEWVTNRPSYLFLKKLHEILH